MIQLTPADMLTAKQMLTEGSPTFSHALAEGIIPGKFLPTIPHTRVQRFFKPRQAFTTSQGRFLTPEGTNGFII